MATDTNQVVPNSSETGPQSSGQNLSTSSTGASGGSAGVSTTVATDGSNPTGAPVVAPKGYRLVLQQMLQGWSAVMPPDSALPTSVGTLTPAAVTSQLQAYVGAYTALDAQTTGYKKARVLEKTQLPETRKYISVLRAALRSYFGEESPQLEQFGLKPKKTPKPLTSEQRTVRAAKALATRQLRSTKGPVQKAAVKSGPMKVSVGPVNGPVAAASPPVSPDASAASPPSGPVASK